MENTAKHAFARRLVQTMRRRGHSSKRNAKSGVDVGPLAMHLSVTREMARRYTEGAALPGANRLQRIAEWLGVRPAWLRDSEGPEQVSPSVVESPATDYMPEEAREIATVWLKLPPERRRWFRDLMCLEAIVASHYPWLMFGTPTGESYVQYEERVERDILRIAQRLTKLPGAAP